MKNILFSSEYDFEEIKNDLAQANDLQTEEVPDSWVYDTIREEQEDDWSYCMERLNSDDSPAYILSAAIWNLYPELYGHGTRYGLKYTTDLEATISKLGDDFEIYEEDGRYFVKFWHHDGGGTVEIIAVNDRGRNYYDRWNNYETANDKTEYEVLETIAKSNFLSHRLRPAA